MGIGYPGATAAVAQLEPVRHHGSDRWAKLAAAYGWFIKSSGWTCAVSIRACGLVCLGSNGHAKAMIHRLLGHRLVTGAMAAFLVSDKARAVTGNTAFVDAGYHVVD